jgi:DNA-binding NarL/FixJ family response regulator
MLSVFMVDDHPAVRQSYALLIRREPDLSVCGEASNGAEAMAQIRDCAPGLVVLDVSLQGSIDGVELLRQLQAEFPEMPVLVVSGHDELVYAQRMLRIGARGYVMKGDALAFLDALRKVARGEIYVSPQVQASGGADIEVN